MRWELKAFIKWDNPLPGFKFFWNGMGTNYKCVYHLGLKGLTNLYKIMT